MTTTKRMYLVYADDFSKGIMRPMRAGTEETLVAVIERCVKDIDGAENNAGKYGSSITRSLRVVDLEVA